MKSVRQRTKDQRDKFVRAIGSRAKRKWPIGARYGRLTIVGHERQANGCWAVLCKCDCGASKTVARPDQMVRELTQSCGCLNRERCSQRRKGKAPSCELPPGEAAFNFLLRGYRQNALMRALPFELTQTEFKHLTQQPCAYCGKLPETTKWASHYNGSFVYNGIDRVDPSKGYTPANAVTCCKQCNRAKRDLALDEFLTWLVRVSKHLSI